MSHSSNPCECQQACMKNDSENHEVQRELVARYWHLQTAVDQLAKVFPQASETSNPVVDSKTPPHLASFAAVDVFVEKSQNRLTTRAKRLWGVGGFFAAIAFVFLIVALCRIYQSNLSDDILRLAPLDGLTVTLMVLRSTTLTGLVLAAVYMAFSFAKAFFDEGVMSHNRRHALRFGRMYVYLKTVNGEPMVYDEMERAFSWGQNASAFKTIKTQVVTATMTGKVLEQPTNIAQAVLSRGQKNGEPEKSATP